MLRVHMLLEGIFFMKLFLTLGASVQIWSMLSLHVIIQVALGFCRLCAFGALISIVFRHVAQHPYVVISLEITLLALSYLSIMKPCLGRNPFVLNISLRLSLSFIGFLWSVLVPHSKHFF